MFYLDGNRDNFDLFDDFSDMLSSSRRNGFLDSDISENENGYELKFNVPGIDKKDISLNFKNKILTISVNENKEVNDEKKHYIRKERFSSSVQRSFSLEDGDESKIKAKLEDGVLIVDVEKNKEVNQNVITIE